MPSFPMSAPAVTLPRPRWWKRWRWKIACAGVAVLTYLAILGAILLPGNTLGENFLFMAFPAALGQFLLIDLARSGCQRKR